ncbi:MULTISPECIES: hypothetical protein [Brevibacillus]|uniref:Uncharacterized protein n=1 Tax=Brevibacillus laterosporus TaxID=1465 RepID=A0AAP8Q8K6_BRELA|nr:MULTISPECIES: hypothetical protein [Brevibacillus]MBG9786326.1 membrane protein [Brevibacillus laterosporus]MBG9797841.1 membrane protein [Brevibacillus laterosporus]MCG7318748.1 hypothetical protein [Brevibacillus laterosporus]MCR8982939.1 hypothetical protein [Brevibacillus laterosporus]MCR8998150.1 hypothetical protein [Brevibacillus laterosporus]
MEESNKLMKFRWKSAFFFFTFVVGLNLLLTPLLTWLGLSQRASLFLVNSLAGGAGVSMVMLYFEGKYKSRKQAITFIIGSLVVCTAASYYLVYLY